MNLIARLFDKFKSSKQALQVEKTTKQFLERKEQQFRTLANLVGVSEAYVNTHIAESLENCIRVREEHRKATVAGTYFDKSRVPIDPIIRECERVLVEEKGYSYAEIADYMNATIRNVLKKED